MNNKNNFSRLRIFLTTSHISTVYMTLYANCTKKNTDTDVLFIDTGKRRKILIQILNETSEFHNWNLIHNFSDSVEQEYDFEPTIQKKLTRKWKVLPVVKNIYGNLLNRHLSKKDSLYKKKIETLLQEFSNFDRVELFLMTQTYLNKPLTIIFPKAEIHYMEHGIGDYFYVLHKTNEKKYFHAVFAIPFQKFLSKQNKTSDWVFSIEGLSRFSTISKKLIERHQKSLQLEKISTPEKEFIFILLEAVDMYEVKDSFWTEYIDHIIKQIAVPSDYHYLLKTH